MSTDHSFRCTIASLQKSEDGAGCCKAQQITNLDLTDPKNAYHSKRAFVQVPAMGNESMCCARSIVVALAKQDKSRDEFKKFIKKTRWHIDTPGSQKREARELLMAVGLPENRAISVNELYKFEQHLQLQIIVVSGDCLNEVSYRGIESREKQIMLYMANGHYTPVVNPRSLMKNKDLCTSCYEWYNNQSGRHSCQGHCSLCERDNCFVDPNTSERCPDCNLQIRNSECMRLHKTPATYKQGEKKGELKRASKCETYYKCPLCTRLINKLKRDISQHVCGEYFCLQCSEFVVQPHYCFYRIKTQRKISNKYIYFDYECTADCKVPCTVEGLEYSPKPQTGCLDCHPEVLCATCRRCVNCRRSYCGSPQFTPNLVCAQTSCDICEDHEWTEDSMCSECGHRCDKCFRFRKDGQLVPVCENDVCGRRQMMFFGAEANDKFCKWFFSKSHKSYIGLAHYAKGFDSLFLLNYLVSHSQTPKTIFQGSKLMLLEDPTTKIRVIDSVSFLPMKLAKLPKCLGLPDAIAKGHFPHFWNTQANQKVVLNHLPDITYYNIDYLSQEEREEIISWHQQNYNQVFDTEVELKKYCASDVIVLRTACVVFKNLVKKATTIQGAPLPGIDVFAETTLAGCCMATFRQLLLTETHDVTMLDGSKTGAFLKAGVWTSVQDGRSLNEDEFLKTKFISSTLPQPPAAGYGNRNMAHSEKSIIWLSYVAAKTGMDISHCRNRGEKKVLNFYLDGYDEKTGKNNI